MHKLMQIEDPFSYLHTKQMSIPKYIINASGDDFYVPDSSKFYFGKLPGEHNLIRYIPNSPHYYKKELVSEDINNYLYFFLNHHNLPKVKWKMTDTKITLDSSIKPNFAKLWIAENKNNRDFRFNNYGPGHGNIKYTAQEIPLNCKEMQTCHIEANLPAVQQGWQAAFIEYGYEIDNHNLVLTTEIKITPDIYP